MTTYDKYCPGKNCKKRDECAMHQFSNICTNFPSLADWSQENFGQYECGDNGNYQYFIPKETPNLTNKQIVEDFLYFLSSKTGIINTGDYTYSYQELRNALISYHKETAAADNYAYAVIPDDEKQVIPVVSKKQIEQFKDEMKPYIQHSPEEAGRAMKELSKKLNSRCCKCVYEMRCSRDKNYEGKCPDYKRDAPDGGYYG